MPTCSGTRARPSTTRWRRSSCRNIIFCSWRICNKWFEYRRTGHPALPKGPGLKNGGVMPARLAYPVYVQSTNPTNYKLAVAAQGPDLISTQVWWQKP
ncbi:SusD/RagB family nutrient-binding outer membrane lipoprotein [Puia sp. P3]|uniref:SusD/RagB family nutrient-binding outer membrane lipoprotein n=1 Tax=Puia sp. P3 TaxID=3423952 RepID=UPI003D66F600